MKPKIKKPKISIALCGILLAGCASEKESRYSTPQTKEPTANTQNSSYFPPHLAVPSLQEDPLAKYQWHLVNIGQNSGAKLSSSEGEDLRLEEIWSSFRGRGVKIAIVDTGVELNHPDLNENIDLSLSYNYKTKQRDPTPTGAEKEIAHGTACAGISAGVGFNQVGVRGVAPAAKIVGLNVFSNPTTASFAQALFRSSEIDIYSNSWGEADILSQGISQMELDAIEDGITYGRGGLGSIYIFSSGNNRKKRHNGNYFQEQNNRFVLSVGALSARGEVASYSNPGANILVSGYGGEDGYNRPAIVTTDTTGLERGFDKEYRELGVMDVAGNENGAYTHLMNGTSAAVPMVAGVVALMLEAARSNNNFLTYRDVKYILATTARKNSPGSPSWFRNGAGHLVSHNFGFGVVNAKEAVLVAQNFPSLKKEKISKLFMAKNSQMITIENTNVDHIEFVDIWVDIGGQDPKDLEISLISPLGTRSVLQTQEAPLPHNFLRKWRFGSVQFLDESSTGAWRLEVVSRQNEAEIYSWGVQFYGH